MAELGFKWLSWALSLLSWAPILLIWATKWKNWIPKWLKWALAELGLMAELYSKMGAFGAKMTGWAP